MSSPLRKLRRNVQGRRHIEALRPVASSENELRMSEVLLEFAMPLLEDAVDEDDFKMMIGIAVLFWDLAFLPENEQPRTLRRMARDLAQGDLEMIPYFKNLGEALLLRKKTLFADVNRTITGHEFVVEGDSLQLFVTSTLAQAKPSRPG